MAYTTIDDPTIYFNTVLYTGNGGTQSITGVGFQPNLSWLKRRTPADSHLWVDNVRGTTKYIRCDLTNAEFTESTALTSFDSDGFSLGAFSTSNGSSQTFVSWNWKAGTSFSNDASATGIGTIDSTGSVNDAAGFSIISFTGTGANGTIKHGLSTAPRAMIFKNRDEGAEGWFVYHESLGNTKKLLLDSNSASSTSSTFFQDTSPTSSIITLGSNHGCNGPDAMICYAFAEKKGYSKFGSYTGNGNANGPLIYTGFKPAWFIVKKSSASGDSWVIIDNKRFPHNFVDKFIYADEADAESGSAERLDLLSNGIKIRATHSFINTSGATYIYMAFAESPFVSSGGIPTTAR